MHGNRRCGCAVACLRGDGVNPVGHIAEAVHAVGVRGGSRNTDAPLVKSHGNIAYSYVALFDNTAEGIERIGAPFCIYRCICRHAGFAVPRSSAIFVRVPSRKVVAGFFGRNNIRRRSVVDGYRFLIKLCIAVHERHIKGNELGRYGIYLGDFVIAGILAFELDVSHINGCGIACGVVVFECSLSGTHRNKVPTYHAVKSGVFRIKHCGIATVELFIVCLDGKSQGFGGDVCVCRCRFIYAVVARSVSGKLNSSRYLLAISNICIGKFSAGYLCINNIPSNCTRQR